MAHNLTDNEKRSVEADEALDAREDESRNYDSGNAGFVGDLIMEPLNWLTGTSSNAETDRAKQDYYEEIRESRNRR